MTSFDLYRVTNKVNGKAYVGITTLGVARRWARHVSNSKKATAVHPLACAIRKYGRDAFLVEHIASARNWDDLAASERLVIAQEGTFSVGYNVTEGGEGITGFRHSAASVKAGAEKRSALYAAARAMGVPFLRSGQKSTPEHRTNQSIGMKAALAKRPTHKARMLAASELARASGLHANSRKLTEGQVFAMRAAKAIGVALRPVAAELGVPYEIARRAAVGQTYQFSGTAGG